MIAAAVEIIGSNGDDLQVVYITEKEGATEVRVVVHCLKKICLAAISEKKVF